MHSAATNPTMKIRTGDVAYSGGLVVLESQPSGATHLFDGDGSPSRSTLSQREKARRKAALKKAKSSRRRNRR